MIWSIASTSLSRSLLSPSLPPSLPYLLHLSLFLALSFSVCVCACVCMFLGVFLCVYCVFLSFSGFRCPESVHIHRTTTTSQHLCHLPEWLNQYYTCPLIWHFHTPYISATSHIRTGLYFSALHWTHVFSLFSLLSVLQPTAATSIFKSNQLAGLSKTTQWKAG